MYSTRLVVQPAYYTADRHFHTRTSVSEALNTVFTVVHLQTVNLLQQQLYSVWPLETE